MIENIQVCIENIGEKYEKKISIAILLAIITYFISINFIFKMPVSTGGYHWSTYVVGIILAILVCCSFFYFTNKSLVYSDAMKKTIKVTMIGFIVVIAIVAIIVSFSGSDNLTADENHAMTVVGKYQKMLKDPDSLILCSDVIVIRKNDTRGEYHTFAFFTASGKNSYGASISSTVYFYDGSYFCDMTLDEQTDFQDNEEELLIYLDGQIALSNWQLYGGDAEAFESCTTVEAKKVAKLLKIEYRE